MTVSTNAASENSPLLRARVRLATCTANVDDVEFAPSGADCNLHQNTPAIRNASWKMRTLQALTVLVSVTLLAVIGVTYFSVASANQSAANTDNPLLWNDASFHQWEDFLNDYSQDATAGLAMVFKSQAKKDAKDARKQLKKQKKLKRKESKHKEHMASHDNGLTELLYLNNTRAVRHVKHDSYNAASDFFLYQQGWEAQINQAYCAIATSAAVLNSLRGVIQLPQDPLYVPFPWATQSTIVTDECVKEAVFDIDSVRRTGLGLGMVPNLLKCFLVPQGYTAVSYPVDPDFSEKDKIKDVVVNALLDEDSRVVLNYDRGGIGQGDMGHGHWSPIGAYSAEIDAFLIMDVAKYKYPPVWVPTENLFGGVATMDVCSAMKQHPKPVDWSSQDFAKIGQELGCTPGYRGFVVIKPISSQPVQ
ncbi:MAG: hypothetical protein SGILL_001072 [Bacillariaceae sp.]